MRVLLIVVFSAVISLSAVPTGEAADDPYAVKRAEMVQLIKRYAAMPGGFSAKRPISENVLNALLKVLRHELVPVRVRHLPYRDGPLPIGHGQTISQPFIVALMTELLKPAKHHVVLEVGTGSGYQAAVLGELVKHVYSIEIVSLLAQRAKLDLKRLGYKNITVRAGDGYKGWPAHAPFDGIIVTAAAPHVPQPLIDQLRPGGRMVIPVKEGFRHQSLMLIEKGKDGGLKKTKIEDVRFVPLTRDK